MPPHVSPLHVTYDTCRLFKHFLEARTTALLVARVTAVLSRATIATTEHDVLLLAVVLIRERSKMVPCEVLPVCWSSRVTLTPFNLQNRTTNKNDTKKTPFYISVVKETAFRTMFSRANNERYTQLLNSLCREPATAKNRNTLNYFGGATTTGVGAKWPLSHTRTTKIAVNR